MRCPRRFPLLPVLAAILTALAVSACESNPAATLDEPLSAEAQQATAVFPADVQAVARLDVQGARQQPALAHFTQFMDADVSEDATLQRFFAETGFDVERDLRDVYVALPMEADAQPLLAIYADYDQDALASFVEDEVGADLRQDTYRGTTIYYTDDDEGAFALVDGQLVIGSPDPQAVRGMLDRLAGQGRTLQDDAETLELVRLANAEGEAWVVAPRLDSGVFQHAEMGEGADLARAARSAVASLRADGDDLHASALLVPAEGVSTSDLADLARGMIAAAKSAVEEPEALEMLDGAEVEVDGDRVRISLDVPASMLEPQP